MTADEVLYERARQGDLAAFDTLYARYERRLFGFLARLMNDRAEAEELFHDTFVKVLESPRDLRVGELRVVALPHRAQRGAQSAAFEVTRCARGEQGRGPRRAPRDS